MDQIYEFLVKIIEMISEGIIVVTEEAMSAIFLFLYEIELYGT